MTNHGTEISLHKAALVAGIVILMMALIAPFAELFAYPKLVNPANAAETVRNITSNKMLFVSAVFGYLLTFAGDVVVSWALHILLKPVNESLSLLAAWFRLVFSVIGLVALLNLVAVFQLLTKPDYIAAFGQTQLYAQVMLYLTTFRSGYHFGILFFSVHLILLGYLVFKSGYIPKVMGLFLIICGLGYLTDALQPFLFPNIHLKFITLTFFGELVFMLWLLIKGSRLGKELNRNQ